MSFVKKSFFPQLQFYFYYFFKENYRFTSSFFSMGQLELVGFRRCYIGYAHKQC